MQYNLGINADALSISEAHSYFLFWLLVAYQFRSKGKKIKKKILIK